MKKEKQKRIKQPLSSKAPNPWHRAERWAGGIVERNRKKYTRKKKHKEVTYD